MCMYMSHHQVFDPIITVWGGRVPIQSSENYHSMYHITRIGIHNRQSNTITVSVFNWINPRAASATRALLRLSPCYRSHLRPRNAQTSGATSFLDLTGGEYKTRERIHRSIADLRLLVIPTSWSRVADFNPNWGRLYRLAPPRGIATYCNGHCITCVAQGIKGHADLASSSPSSPLSIYELYSFWTQWSIWKKNKF